MRNSETPKADVERVLAEFDIKEDMLAAFCVKTKALIEAMLEDADIRYQSVQFRVKSKKKLREKYLDPSKNYTRLEDITDLAGLRIITYYEDEVDHVADVIRREFCVDVENSVDKRKTAPDKFGYSALNYVCSHLPKRTADVEYKKFACVRCEIQITSVLRHAWSEIEHEWYDLKDAYPDEVRRRFYRIAALLELAESEFRDIRTSRTQYERSVAVRVEARLPDLPVDAVSLRSFIEQEPIVNSIDISLVGLLSTALDAHLSDALVEARSKAVNAAGLTTLNDLRNALVTYRLAIPEFVDRCRKEVWVLASGRPVPRGLSIMQLAIMLISAQGRDAISQYYYNEQVNIHWDLDAQVAIAGQVTAKYKQF